MVPTETKMFFHVSSKKSSSACGAAHALTPRARLDVARVADATDSKRFAGLIMESLREMKEMFERVHKAKAAK